MLPDAPHVLQEMQLDLLQLLFIIGQGKALVVQGQREHHNAFQWPKKPSRWSYYYKPLCIYKYKLDRLLYISTVDPRPKPSSTLTTLFQPIRPTLDPRRSSQPAGCSASTAPPSCSSSPAHARVPRWSTPRPGSAPSSCRASPRAPVPAAEASPGWARDPPAVSVGYLEL